MSFDVQPIRRDRERLEQVLKSAGAVFRGNSVKCLWHDDQHPSAGIYRNAEGVWRFHCQVCDIDEDVIGVHARIEKKTCPEIVHEMAGKDAPRPEKKPRYFPDLEVIKRATNAECVYAYVNPETKIADMAVARIQLPDGGKTFRQYSPLPGGGFTEKAPPKPWPIYNRTRLLAADEAWVVEGEKCVHAMHAAGAVATTCPGGGAKGKAVLADWRPLAGKTVFLWPDRDDVGIEHMRAVAVELERLDPPPVVLWIDPSELDLPAKGDAADYFAPCPSGEERRRSLEAVKSIAAPTGPGEELDRLIDDTISGKRSAIPWPFPQLSNLSRALMPGTVTAICGDPGCSKSFLMLESSSWWHAKVKVALYEMEDDRAYHLNRLLAQLEDNSSLIDDVWVRSHPDETRQARERHREHLDSFARCIFTAPEDTDVTLDQLLAWVKDRCEAGCRILAIDPITAAASGEKVWLEDRRFILMAKGIVRKHGASLILVTHPKLNSKGGSPLQSMAGGAAYPRFAHTVIWVHAYPEYRRALIKGPCGQFSTSINRSLRIGKARNGPGSGVELGYVFEGKSLRFSEQGAVQKKTREPEESETESPV